MRRKLKPVGRARREQISSLRRKKSELHEALRKVEQDLEHATRGLVRHSIPTGSTVCWCGSTHSWSLAKHGYCQCKKPRCTDVHKEEDDA